MAYTPTGLSASTGHPIVQDDSGAYFLSAGRGGYQALTPQELALITGGSGLNVNEVRDIYTDSGGLSANTRQASMMDDTQFTTTSGATGSLRDAADALYTYSQNAGQAYAQLPVLELWALIPQLQGVQPTEDVQYAVMSQLGASYDPLLGWIAPQDLVRRLRDAYHRMTDMSRGTIGGMLESAFFSIPGMLMGAGIGDIVGGLANAPGAGAGGAMDMGAGFGGGTLDALGLGAADLTSVLGNAFTSALDPAQLASRATSGAIDQLRTQGEINPMALGTSLASGVLNNIGGNLLGQLDFSLPDFGGVDAPPVGYMSEMDLGGFADMAPGADADWSNLFGSASYVNQPGVDMSSEAALLASSMNPDEYADLEAEIGILTGELPIEAYLDPGFAEYLGTAPAAVGPGAEVPTEDVEAPVEPDAEAPAEEPSKAESPEKAKGSKPISAKTLLSAAKALLPLLAGDQEASSAARGARRVVEREYANEGERQTAYAEYAAQLLAFLPEIEKLGLDPATLRGAFGEAYVDPETGEVGYRMTAEGQRIYDQMMDAANNALSTALGTDVTKLSEERFNAAMEKLQSKRDADFAALSRALYARGLLGLMTYQEAGVDLLTGQTEAWDLAEGQGANPYMAAYQARVARENADIARGSMDESEAYVESLLNHAGGLLGRGQDIAGGARAALDDLGVYVDENDELKRGKMRGLYSQLVGPGGAYFQRLEGMLPTGRAMAALADVDQAEMAKRLAAYEAAMRALEDRG
jgi:hypothetical protein